MKAECLCCGASVQLDQENNWACRCGCKGYVSEKKEKGHLKKFTQSILDLSGSNARSKLSADATLTPAAD